MAWKVSKTPTNYQPPNRELWSIIDDDGDIHGFYDFNNDATRAYYLLTGKGNCVKWFTYLMRMVNETFPEMDKKWKRKEVIGYWWSEQIAREI